MGAQRINGTRFQLNDGTGLPNFPNSVANSTLAYTHWNYYHYLAPARWVVLPMTICIAAMSMAATASCLATYATALMGTA